jgi:hypothetical protein
MSSQLIAALQVKDTQGNVLMVSDENGTVVARILGSFLGETLEVRIDDEDLEQVIKALSVICMARGANHKVQPQTQPRTKQPKALP